MTGKTMQTLDGYEINEVQLFGGGPLDAADVILVRRRQRDGESLWAIYDHGANLNLDGEWELEPQPSSRDGDFIRRCRFSSPEEALAVWHKLQYPTRFWRYYPELQNSLENHHG